jgi:bifunctional UDP-N-acetylglucosamine pyrophosphorylase/glucosamine-1-phosphate N-acetyltransferase
VAPDATVQYTVCESAEIGSGASIGPFAYLRPGTRVGAGARIGPYVELKNAMVGEGAAIPRLTYLDATGRPAGPRPDDDEGAQDT